jgi:serine/threonine protein kinase/ribosomal protein S27E
MPEIAACPDPARYRQMASGQLAPEVEEALLQHLAGCDTCARRVEALPDADSLIDLLRQAGSRHADGPSAEKIARLVERLSKRGLTATASAAEEKTLAPTPSAPPALSLPCPACGKKLKVPAKAAGKKVKCPACGRVLPVPGAIIGPEGRSVSLNPPPADRTRAVAPPANRPTHFGSPEAAGGCQGAESGPDSSLIEFLSPPQSGDELGRLGKYRILKVLGHGGMGVVFKAEDPLLKRTVAVKAMLPGLAACASAGKRFLREAQAIAAVDHDHIVRIHEVAEDRGVPYMAMEFLEGEPLDARLEREGKLPVLELVRIGKEIALGLAAAHARGLIHRDVKPANIWLEARPSPLTPNPSPPKRGRGEKEAPLSAGGRGVGGEGARVKILDFGLARSAEEGSALTQQGATLGTPAYMAPEQTRGEAVDARCDLFSLGVLLYRLRCGKPPFQGRDMVSTIMAVATEEPPPVAVDPELPAELSALVVQLMQKDAERRPASAAAVVEALQALDKKLLREQETQAQTSPRSSRPRAKRVPSKRRRRLVGVAAGLALLLGGLVAALIVVQIRDRQGKVVGEYPVPEGGEVRIVQPGAEKALPQGKADGAHRGRLVQAGGCPAAREEGGSDHRQDEGAQPRLRRQDTALDRPPGRRDRVQLEGHAGSGSSARGDYRAREHAAHRDGAGPGAEGRPGVRAQEGAGRTGRPRAGSPRRPGDLAGRAQGSRP